MLTGSVGLGGVNLPADVRIVQQRLNDRLGLGLVVDGVCGPATIAAIKQFQAQIVGLAAPDGLISPDGTTIHALAPAAFTGAGVPADIVAAAQAAQAKYGVPAAISIAQWILESGRGAHMPPGSNNPFGIKAVGSDPFVMARTREVVDGNSVYIDAKFKQFASIADAFDQHAKLLATSHYYAPAMAVRNDPDAFADRLTGVYATDPHYGTALKEIMRGGNLYAYDTLPAGA